MSRLFSLSLFLALFLGANLGNAADSDTLTSVDYFLPVTYDMVITREVPKATGDANKQRTDLAYEIFNSRDLLKSILNANGITSLSHWSLVARGNTATFSDPRATDTLSSLEIVARNSKTKEIKTAPSDRTIGFTQIYGTVSYSRTERQDEDKSTTPATYTLLTSTTSLSRIAEVTQKLPVRSNHVAGTLVVTGHIAYTNVLNKVAVGKQTTETAVLRPVNATFRASGLYTADGSDDGMAEIRIIFGTPSYAKPDTSSE